MKRIGLAGLVVYILLLLATQGASAQMDGRPAHRGAMPGTRSRATTCSECLIGPAAEAVASKPAGLARAIPATSPKQPASCGSGENPDVLPVTCLDGPDAAAEFSLNACRAGAAHSRHITEATGIVWFRREPGRPARDLPGWPRRSR